ncbi:MAG: carboxypeptidase-like regulatory domain-containing protein [Gemmatimonadota bacterium]
MPNADSRRRAHRPAGRRPSDASGHGPRTHAPDAFPGAPVVAVTALAIGLLGPAPTTAQQTTDAAGLHVTITVAETGQPVPDALVRVGGPDGRTARADADGVVRIGGLAPGTHLVTISADGYGVARARLTLASLQVTHTAFALGPETDSPPPAPRLRPAPIMLDPIDVTVRRRVPRLVDVGFYQRAKRGALGTFLTPEDIAERLEHTAFLSRLFWGVPGLRIMPSGLGTRYRLESTRGPASLNRPCTPQIWLDGIPMGPSAAQDINGLLSVDAVLAVEIYSGPAETPPQFNVTGSACGAVVIWTGPRPRA